MANTLIHTFLYDADFINTASITDPVLKAGGVCVLSPRGLSYFVNPQEITDPRTSRSASLNTTLTKQPQLVVDQTEFPQFLTDVQNTWSLTERENLFAIIDQLLFAYNANATPATIELALTAYPQYLPNSYVLSNTVTATTNYGTTTPANITVPDYVTFTFVIANGTQYEFQIWANNTVFLTNYPLSTVAVVVPPLSFEQLYSTNLVSGIASIFTTAAQTSALSQQTLQSYIQSGEYSGFVAQNVTFVDANNDSVQVQFNLLYNGAVPGAIAIRTAIRNLLVNSGTGTSAGWQARAPSLFVTQLWYLLPLWENKTSQVASFVYPNIVPLSVLNNDATKILYDVSSGFVTSNIDVLTAYYNNLTLAAVPDSENAPTRLSLAAEHPTYQDVAPTDVNFNYMAQTTQQFASLLGAALSAAAGNVTTNVNLTTYTPSGDNRTYITFSVNDVEYYVITQASYLAIV